MGKLMCMNHKYFLFSKTAAGGRELFILRTPNVHARLRPPASPHPLKQAFVRTQHTPLVCCVLTNARGTLPSRSPFVPGYPFLQRFLPPVILTSICNCLTSPRVAHRRRMDADEPQEALDTYGLDMVIEPFRETTLVVEGANVSLSGR